MITKSYCLSPVSCDDALLRIVGNSPAMSLVKSQLKRISSTDLNFLLLGESGTGKTLMARIAHELSQRRGKPFVCINMAAIPESIMESELFGTVCGAYTGAVNKAGFVAAAGGGTLFLDEIAEMPLSSQAKLLHFVETGNFFRVGSTAENHVDVRIICATNADLEGLVREKKFNEALYYRIRKAAIRIPPLRTRKEDIKLISESILKKRGYSFSCFSKEALERLENYEWPGNVRQLDSCLQVTCELYRDQIIGPEDLVF